MCLSPRRINSVAVFYELWRFWRHSQDENEHVIDSTTKHKHMVLLSSNFLFVRKQKWERIAVRSLQSCVFRGITIFYIAVAYVTGERGVCSWFRDLGMVLACFIERLERRGQEGVEGGGAGGGSGKCKLIGSKRIVMFTAAFGEQHLAQCQPVLISTPPHMVEEEKNAFQTCFSFF